MDISAWLLGLGLGEYAASLTENKIDAELLAQLTDDDLKALGVSALGDRKRLLAAIEALDEDAEVARGETAPAVSAHARAPLAYTPSHLAERILNSRHGLEGERKHVTMLFADIKGSTALIENLDPEDAAGHLSPALATMMDAVHRYEGTVNRVQGDGIMALFGAPLAHEDHAVRACFAAIAIRDSFEGGLDVRVGLHCGEVLVRAVRNDLSMDYDVVGSSAHLAARMEQSAVSGTIRITEAVRSLANGYIETQSLGALSVKGLRQKVEVHELLGRTSLQTRWEARASHGLTTFVGRRRELESLLAAVEGARAGRGQLVSLVGDAGMGKSRLMHEFASLPQLHDWTFYQTGALPHDTNTPYLPLGILLRAIFDVSDRDDQTAIENKMRTGLARFVANVDPLLPVTQVLMDLPASDPSWIKLNPQQQAIRIIDGAKNLLLKAAESQPMVLIFEDLHWVDSGSQKVLNALVDAMAAHPLLLVVSYRPEYQHEWTGKSYYTRTRVDPLADTACHEMLDALLGSDRELEPLKRLLIERTEGRPLFIEETVRSLKEAGVLSERDGEIQLERDPANIEIPTSVQDVLAARIDRLAPELKSLLQTAAVIGRRVPVHLLQTMVTLSHDALQLQLSALQSSEFLYEIATGQDATFLFKHALTEEVTYASLTRDTRRELHGHLVEAIENAYAGRLEEHLEELGRHAMRAKRWDKAFVYNREAAKKAHGRSAYPAAIERFDDALTALDHLPDDDVHLIDKMDIRLEMRTALWPLGRHDELEKRLREAGELAERAGDTRRLANVQNFLTAHYWRAGEHARAIEHGERGIALAEEVDDFSILYTTIQHVGVALSSRGEFERQVELHRRVAGKLNGQTAYHRHGMAGYPAAITRGYLAWGLAELGEFDEALMWAREGVAIASEVNSAMSTVWVTSFLGLTLLRRGELDQAIAILEPNFELCERAEVRLLRTIASGVLGLAFSAVGRHSDAIPLLERAVQPELLSHHPQGSGYPYVWLADAYLRAARLADAREAVARAVEIAEKQSERGHEAWARFTQAEFEKANGSPMGAVNSAYEVAHDLAVRAAMRPLAALCKLGFALTADDAKEATNALSEARSSFLDMGMRHWLDQAERINKSHD
ncbi:MAG: adenylate/guanylate cyclase domain-containing protein [Gammaproteobacteria bacterium]|nr:adenylate/guanylate cyclase domain-containing protein [Gammaproteobacteria bacterium]MDX2461563.1 adenylate/guanylate cyclase domain-containing protein [Gammaproteobacteria bacterium]